MGDHHAIDIPVVADGGADGGLPVDNVGRRRLDSGQMRVFQVDKQATLLAEVAYHHMLNALRRAVVPSGQHRLLRCHLQYETIFTGGIFFS